MDIIPWSRIWTYVNAAVSAKLKAFEVDEAGSASRSWFSNDQLSLAIGRRGQNARLTSKLTGWGRRHRGGDHRPLTRIEEKVAEEFMIWRNLGHH